MASVTSQAFPVGATVEAFVKSKTPGRTTEGAAVSSGVVGSSGSVTISGLSEGETYLLTDGATRTVGHAVLSDPVESGVHGARVMAMGDSLVADTGPINSGDTVQRWGAGAYNPLGWAHVLSGGKIVLCDPPLAATGGMALDAVITTHLPTVLSERPDFCLVSDYGADTAADFTTRSGQIVTICDALTDVGITPVLCTQTPTNSTPNYGADRYNSWLATYARLKGYPLVDWYATGVDPAGLGAWKSGYSRDSVHPNDTGAKAMGQAVVDALSPFLPPGKPFLVSHNTFGADDLATMLRSNPLSLVDTNADGLPDNWQIEFGAPTSSIVASPGGGVIGSMYRITRAAANAASRHSTLVTIPAGNRVYLAFQFAAGVKSVGGNFSIGLQRSDGGSNVMGLVDWAEDVPVGSVFSTTFTMPNLTTTQQCRFFLRVNTGVGAWVQVGQPTVIDLTAAGLAVGDI